MKQILYWLRYRKHRKEHAQRAASLAVRMVMNGCLTPARLSGAKGAPGARGLAIRGPLPYSGPFPPRGSEA